MAGALGAISFAGVAGIGAGCATTTTDFEDDGTGATAPTTTTTTGNGGAGQGGGAGGTMVLPCGIDCSMIQAPACNQAQCNTTTLQCEIVPVTDGDACDDDVFCTDGDTCQAGMCVGGPPNTCGMTPAACQSVTCNETNQNCNFASVANGTACQPTNLCISGASCTNGLCIGGTPTDCFFFPVPDACHVAQCNQTNGLCESVVGNEGGPCNDATDLCTVNKTCSMGMCQGGVPKDCSALTVGCNQGVCNTTNGLCVTMAVMNGQPCNDLNPCTTGEICTNGNCGGGSTITQCMNGDFCCPMNCTAMTDTDCGFCDWSSSVFPIPATGASNSVGDMTFDNACNILTGADGGEIRRFTHNTTTVTQIYDFNNYVRAITFNKNNGLLYAGVNTQLYSLTTSGMSVTMVGPAIGGILQGLQVAPAGWGAYGGHLIVGRNGGQIYAVDPSNPVPTLLGTTTANVSDLFFDGQTLYVAAYEQSRVLTMTPSGTFSTFVTTPCSPDGLAIRQGMFVFFSCGGANQIHKATIPGGVISMVTTASLNASWAPSAMLFDGLDNLIVLTEGSPPQLTAYTP